MAEKKTEIDYLQDLEKAHKKYLDLIKSQEALSKECKNLTDELRSVHREYMKEPELRTAAIKETKAKSLGIINVENSSISLAVDEVIVNRCKKNMRLAGNTLKQLMILTKS